MNNFPRYFINTIFSMVSKVGGSGDLVQLRMSSTMAVYCGVPYLTGNVADNGLCV